MTDRKLEAFFCALALLVTSVKGFVLNASCSRTLEEVCISSLGIQPPDMPNLFPDEEYLNANCDLVLRGMRCATKFNRTCPFARNPVDPIRSFEELTSLAETICDKDSSLHKNYVANVACINGLKDQIKQQFDKASEMTNNFTKLLKSEDGEYLTENKWRAIYCTVHKYVIGEFLTDVFEKCDTEATIMEYEIILQVFTPYKVLCPFDNEDIQEYVRKLEGFYLNTSLTQDNEDQMWNIEEFYI